MKPETVKICGLVLSKTAFDAIFPFLAALTGTIVGGFITYLTTRKIENKKWEKEKRHELQLEIRKGLLVALKWIEPLKIALFKATSLGQNYQKKMISEDEFNKRYPDMIASLSKYDLSAAQRAILPKNVYTKSSEIIEGLEIIKNLSFSEKNNLLKIVKTSVDLEKKVSDMQKFLESEYRNTFT